jgi:fatty-acyl-CoA synthase
MYYPTLKTMFEQTVERYPDRNAVIYPKKGQRWTYAEWNSKVNNLASSFLNMGIKKGDRVSLFLYNSSEFVTALFALVKIGAVFNPINYRLAAKELAYIVNDAGSRVLIFEEAVRNELEKVKEELTTVERFIFTDSNVPDYALNFYDLLEGTGESVPDIEITENDLYIIMYTSGTTGRPKGVLHSHRSMVEHNMSVIADQQLTYQDIGLCAAPLYHAAELHVFFLARVHVCATNVITHMFNPKEVLQLIQDEKISVLFGAPTMLNMLLQENVANYDLSTLRLVGYGGASMAPAMVKQCHEILKANLIQYYGMTEMGPAVTVLFPEEQLPKAGAAGRALLNHEIRVVRPREDAPSEPDDLVEPGDEIGEIIVRGPSMMTGYFNLPDVTEKKLYKGWYHSGDLARIDHEGYIWIADRIDDMIISGAENIYPREVEDALFEHPDVLEAAVIGRADAKWGKIVTAFIVSKTPDLTAETLDSYLKNSGRLAAYKRPRQYEFVTELPKTPSGKVQKFKIK